VTLPGYKYHLRSPLETTSHSFSSFLSCLGFPSLVLYFPIMEGKRGIKRESSNSAVGSHVANDVRTPPSAPSGTQSPPGSPSEVSSHCPCSPVFEQGGPPGRLQLWIYLHLRMRKNPSMILLMTLSSPNVSSTSSTVISWGHLATARSSSLVTQMKKNRRHTRRSLLVLKMQLPLL
jgi:hypothetical protein